MQAHRPGEILVIDGNSDFLTFAANTLGRRGHAVRICAYTDEAKTHLERHLFDAVICGSQLADGSGIELCIWIKSHEDLQGIPVALTVDSALVKNPENPIEDMVRGLADNQVPLAGPLSPDEFLLLPVRGEEFVIRVAGLLRLRRYREEIGNTLTTLLSVAEGIEEQERHSRGHCKRLSLMSVLLGSALGCDDYQLLSLERAGYLHDIGKVAIPGAILEKSQPLTPREMEIIKEHTVLGERMCRDVMALQAVLPIIRHHHERGDGSGYPDGLRTGQIPLLVSIFSIVDVYDSLRTWRPYRPPLTQNHAIDVMRAEVARGFWNRDIFDIFAAQVVPVLDEHFRTANILWPAV